MASCDLKKKKCLKWNKKGLLLACHDHMWLAACVSNDRMCEQQAAPSSYYLKLHFLHRDKSNTDYQLSDTPFTNKELDPPVITFTIASMCPLSGPKFGLELHL